MKGFDIRGKRRFCHLLLLLMLFVGCIGGGTSCGAVEKDYLFYQEGVITVSGVYVKNGISYEVDIVKEADGSGSVFYHGPERVAGLAFRCGEEGVTLLYGDLTLPLGKIDHDSVALLSFFSLEKDRLEGLSAEEDGIRLSFGDTTVLLSGETELPTEIEGNAGGTPLKLTVERIEKGKNPR